MKSSQRLDYSTLSEILGQRNLVDPQRLTLALQTSVQGTMPFPEILVTDGLIGDWELSKTVCDLYGLPFLPVDIVTPQEDAREGLDVGFLLQHRLVPVNRFGNLLVVAMPALVPNDILGTLASKHGLQVLPLVGSVQSNSRWLQENLVGEATPIVAGPDDDWSNIFDEGDAAVLLDLQSEPITDEGEIELLQPEPEAAASAPEAVLPQQTSGGGSLELAQPGAGSSPARPNPAPRDPSKGGLELLRPSSDGDENAA